MQTPGRAVKHYTAILRAFEESPLENGEKWNTSLFSRWVKKALLILVLRYFRDCAQIDLRLANETQTLFSNLSDHRRDRVHQT